MFSLKHNHHRPRWKRHKESWILQDDQCCRSSPAQSFILQSCTLPSPANQVAYLSLPGPNTRWIQVIASAVSYNQIDKKGQIGWLWTTKSATRTQRRFSCHSKSQAKEWSSDRSPVWRSQFCLKLWFKVMEKRLCASLGLLACSVNLFTLSTLFGRVDTHLYSIVYELNVSDRDIFFLTPSSLSLFSCQTDYKKFEMKCGLWMFFFCLKYSNFQHYSELSWGFSVK